MAAGDQYRRIESNDSLIFDSTNALVGIRSGKSNTELRLGGSLTAAEVEALTEIVALAGYERIFPTWGGLTAGSIQFRGAADTAASLGTLGLILGASTDAEAASRLAANDADEISTIDGSSTGGLPHFIELPAAVSDCHLGQIGMTAPYSLVTSGTVDAATSEFVRLIFAEPVSAVLWTEYSATDYAGTPGTGSARLCTVVGLVAA